MMKIKRGGLNTLILTTNYDETLGRTLENNGYEYIIDKGGNYTITYNSQTHNLIFTIHNNVLKNYELYSIVVNNDNIGEGNIILSEYYNEENNFAVGVGKEIDPTQEITATLKFHKK